MSVTHRWDTRGEAEKGVRPARTMRQGRQTKCLATGSKYNGRRAAEVSRPVREHRRTELEERMHFPTKKRVKYVFSVRD